MLYLQTENSEPGTLYFDVQEVEERRHRDRSYFAVTGICGDGRWEGQVLVEVDGAILVTFVDEWLDPAHLREFFLRHERSDVESALARALAGLRVRQESAPALAGRPRRRVLGCTAQGRWLPQRPRHWGEQLELPLSLAEEGPVWGCRAA